MEILARKLASLPRGTKHCVEKDSESMRGSRSMSGSKSEKL